MLYIDFPSVSVYLPLPSKKGLLFGVAQKVRLQESIDHANPGLLDYANYNALLDCECYSISTVKRSIYNQSSPSDSSSGSENRHGDSKNLPASLDSSGS